MSVDPSQLDQDDPKPPVEPTPPEPTPPEPSTEEPVDPFIQSVKDASTRSLDDIISGVNPPPQVPLGGEDDLPPLPPSEVDNLLDGLKNDVEGAEIEDPNASPEAIKNFKGMKTRYKNNIDRYKGEYKAVLDERDNLKTEVEELRSLAGKAQSAEELETKLKSAEEELAEAKSRNEQLSHYQKKYDFENDPLVKQTILRPMQEIKNKGLDIIENNHMDASFWQELMEADSEYQINSSIDAAGIEGMNAQSLKSYINQYRGYQQQFEEASSPDNIDAAIQQMRGKTLRITEERAGDIFENMKSSFSEHIKEIRESDVNKEHNIFVYDKVVDESKKRFEQFRQILGPQYQSDKVLALIAQSAIMAAAYPLQSQYTEHVMKSYDKLLQEVAQRRGGQSIKQSKEAPSTSGFLTDVESIKQTASKSLDDIVKDVRK